MRDVIRIYETAMEFLRPSPVIAIALNTFDLTDHDARAAIAQVQRETRLPATDPVRYDAAPIAEAISGFHVSRIARA